MPDYGISIACGNDMNQERVFKDNGRSDSFSLRVSSCPGVFVARAIRTTTFFILLCLPIFTSAQSLAKIYPDGHGGRVTIPLGDIAFADKIVRYFPGDPAPVASAMDSSLCRGIPDFDNGDGGFLTLGCGGSVILQFTNNALVNGPGNDLFVFELGKYVEKTRLSISRDGKNWIDVGDIEGGNTAVDISKAAKPGEVFNYVRLTDLRSDCKGSWPGADIDAVAAVGSGRQYTLNTEVLFDPDQAVIKSAAKPSLDSLIASINAMPVSQVVISGHTDSLGTDAHNKDLSSRRAKAVNAYIKARVTDKTVTFYNFGYGEMYPVAPNLTDEGRKRNRRVEVVVVPG
ncbi:MAG: OmpA/MotB [Bacteroidetes bacterium]|nr:MAG: OmpA/MotB [Bacteroidota bacterium]